MSENNLKNEVRQKALSAMLTDAFFTWPSALTIALTILAFFSGIQLFEGWQPWYWLILGGLMEVIYLVVTLSDPTARQQAVRRMLTEKYDPRDIKNTYARAQLQKALEYQSSISRFVLGQSGPLKSTLEETATEIEDWVGLIYRLARSLDQFESNAIINRDRVSVPTELATLERRLKNETDPGVKAQLEEAISIRRAQAADLKKVENQIKRTEIKMESTVAQLSTIYTKLQLIEGKELDSSRARRLQQEIHDEVSSLTDIVDAMDDVYSYGGGYTAAVQNLRADEDDERASGPGMTRRTTKREQ